MGNINLLKWKKKLSETNLDNIADGTTLQIKINDCLFYCLTLVYSLFMLSAISIASASLQ